MCNQCQDHSVAIFLILLTLSGLIAIIAGSILNFHYLIITGLCLLIVAGVIFAFNRHEVLGGSHGSCISLRNCFFQPEATKTNITKEACNTIHDGSEEQRLL